MLSWAFRLSWRRVLDPATASETRQGLKRTGECVLNPPCVEQVGAVDRLAFTAGSQL